MKVGKVVVDIRERHYGRILPDSGDADVGALVRRLLLFEDCTLESGRLREIRPMLNVFGFDGVIGLLECPDFHVICDPRMLAVAHDGTPGHFRPVITNKIPKDAQQRWGNDRTTYQEGLQSWFIDETLQSVRSGWALSAKRTGRLFAELEQRIGRLPDAAVTAAGTESRRDLLEVGSTFQRTVVTVLRAKGIAVQGRAPSIETELISADGTVHVSSNLSEFGLDAEGEKDVIGTAIQGISGLNQRLCLMDELHAVTGFRDEDLPIFEQKLLSLVADRDARGHERTFDRVVTIAGLPSVDSVEQGGHADVHRLLALRDRREWREFRQWLRSVNDASSSEIEDQVRSVGGRIASSAQSRAGHVARFLLTDAVGTLAPPLVGKALSIVDQFLVERLLGTPGPIAGISNRYRSVYEP